VARALITEHHFSLGCRPYLERWRRDGVRGDAPGHPVPSVLSEKRLKGI
jgi:hypothetical protein